MKRRVHLSRKTKKLVEACNSPSEFWRFVKAKMTKRSCTNKITCDEWKLYFEHLLNLKNTIDLEFEEEIREYMLWHDRCCELCASESVNDDIVNKDISIEEVEQVVSNLEIKNAPGIDGVTNEILKEAR